MPDRASSRCSGRKAGRPGFSAAICERSGASRSPGRYAAEFRRQWRNESQSLAARRAADSPLLVRRAVGAIFALDYLNKAAPATGSPEASRQEPCISTASTRPSLRPAPRSGVAGNCLDSNASTGPRRRQARPRRVAGSRGPQLLQQGRPCGRLRVAESQGPTKMVGGERVELPTSSV